MRLICYPQRWGGAPCTARCLPSHPLAPELLLDPLCNPRALTAGLAPRGHRVGCSEQRRTASYVTKNADLTLPNSVTSARLVWVLDSGYSPLTTPLPDEITQFLDNSTCNSGQESRGERRERIKGHTVQLVAATAQHTKLPQCQTDTDRPGGYVSLSRASLARLPGTRWSFVGSSRAMPRPFEPAR